MARAVLTPVGPGAMNAARKATLATMVAAGVFLGCRTAAADDVGWRQPGVRVWYVGASAGYSGQSDAEEANLIATAGAGLRVVRHQAVGFWSAPLPVGELPAPDPAREGPFWISPQRLRQMHLLDAVTWQGLSLVVKARVTYQDPADLPFIAFLPVQALYRTKAPRELITLTGDNDGVVGDYFFDVETGLGLSSTRATPGFYIMMMLSEINYDFATRQAFAEDDGPHTGFRARQSAGRVDFPVNQFYLFEERIVSRYGASVRADLTLGVHNIATGQSVQADYHSIFDGDARQFLVTPNTGGLGLTAATWTQNGTHPFFWIPPADLTLDAIRVWDTDLTRHDPVGTDSVFEATGAPATWGFTRLQLDPQGFVREMTVASPSMSFAVDSRDAPPSSRIDEITGRAYYLETMGRAVPTADERDLGIMAMKVPKRIVLGKATVTRRVSVRLQNHAVRPEIVTDAAALAALVTLDVESLGACPSPAAAIVAPSRFPITLGPKKARTIVFAVPFACANDPLASSKTASHADYSYVASVHAAADADPHDDACPHDAPPGHVDPMNPKVKDKGCGAMKADRTRGGDLLTDVVVR